MRHADAGYDQARTVATERGMDLPGVAGPGGGAGGR
jgi:urocanate hydratase